MISTQVGQVKRENRKSKLLSGSFIAYFYPKESIHVGYSISSAGSLLILGGLKNINARADSTTFNTYCPQESNYHVAAILQQLFHKFTFLQKRKWIKTNINCTNDGGKRKVPTITSELMSYKVLSLLSPLFFSHFSSTQIL